MEKNVTPLPRRFGNLHIESPILNPHLSKNDTNFKSVIPNANVLGAVVILGYCETIALALNALHTDLHFRDLNTMSQQLDRQRLEYAFQGHPDLIGAIKHAASMFISKSPL
jgi:hypothetical protein